MGRKGTRSQPRPHRYALLFFFSIFVVGGRELDAPIAHELLFLSFNVHGDNASNVGKGNSVLVDMLHEDGRGELNRDNVTIRCLPHVIHLSVLDLLLVLKVVKKTDVREDQLDVEELTEELAELVGGDGEENVDSVVSAEQEAAGGDEFDASPFVKVMFNNNKHRLSLTQHTG